MCSKIIFAIHRSDAFASAPCCPVGYQPLLDSRFVSKACQSCHVFQQHIHMYEYVEGVYVFRWGWYTTNCLAAITCDVLRANATFVQLNNNIRHLMHSAKEYAIIMDSQSICNLPLINASGDCKSEAKKKPQLVRRVKHNN